jgi:hypothetical protein
MSKILDIAKDCAAILLYGWLGMLIILFGFIIPMVWLVRWVTT